MNVTSYLDIRSEKLPIASIRIASDLSRIRLTIRTDKTAKGCFGKQQDSLLATITPKYPEIGHAFKHKKCVSINKLKNIYEEGYRLQKEKDPKEAIFSWFAEHGVRHTIQYPIMELIEAGFISKVDAKIIMIYIYDRLNLDIGNLKLD